MAIENKVNLKKGDYLPDFLLDRFNPENHAVEIRKQPK
jgi:hypothetical protein